MKEGRLAGRRGSKTFFAKAVADMEKNMVNHPCFNDAVRHQFGRVHLPVAPRCNIQCNFCNRSFDCVNESRPGVTSSVMSPKQAIAYLDYLLQKKPQITVVGIAGPGDPFANPEQTMETLELVRTRYPEMLLCLASNGLNLPAYAGDLARLNVSHVTITVNTLRVETAAKIYSWVRYGKHVYTGTEAAMLLLKNQEQSIRLLKDNGVTVKINTVVIKGINDGETGEIARKMKEMGADIINPMAMYENREAVFGPEQVPDTACMQAVKKDMSVHLPIMSHCARCRADAAGLLHETMKPEDMEAIRRFAGEKTEPLIDLPATKRKARFVAVASQEGLLVNQHLGEAQSLLIYAKTPEGIHQIETRPTPEPGGGDRRWEELAARLEDCCAVLTSGAGVKPREILQAKGLKVFQVEGLIEELIEPILAGRDISRQCIAASVCGSACSGSGMGCG